MATSTVLTNKPINPRGDDNRPVDSYNRASLYSGKALDFDGVNDYVTVENITDTYKSFCFYFKPDADITAASSYERLFGIYEQYFGISTGAATGIVTGETLIFIANGGGRFGTTMEFVADTWYHVAVVAKESDNTYLMYINGQDKTDLVSGTHIPSAAIKVRLAWDAQGNGTKFNGQIANFKAFSEVLTATQVSDLYNNPEKVVPTGVDNTALKLWLPMMEGAGTTAYDGSGNGNHGTISGATWVQGVGAPVAQTAVIDWNKLYVFDKTDDYASTTSYTDVTGTKTYKVSFEVFDTSTDEQQIFQFFNVSAGKGVVATYNTFGTYKRLGFRGYASGADFGASSWNDVEHNTPYELVFTINWDTETLESISLSGDAPVGTSTARMNPVFTGLVVGYRWNAYPFGGFINYFEVVGEEKWTNASGFKSESGSYDMTISGSPTQILAPQGLTSGRDITGVNLFENVRKQGALNLDGNSWAEVHDNASLDFGTGSFSLEAWAKVKYVAQGSSYNVIMSMGLNISNAYSVGMLVNQQLEPIFIYNNTGTAESARTEGEWLHIVGTYDETSATIYVNGVQKDQDVRTTVDTTNPLVKHIGRDTTSVRFYNDQIAQPRIYNRALTAAEVLNNYNATSSLYI